MYVGILRPFIFPVAHLCLGQQGQNPSSMFTNIQIQYYSKEYNISKFYRKHTSRHFLSPNNKMKAVNTPLLY